MKISTVVPALLAAALGFTLVGCAVDADDDPAVVTTPGNTDVHVTNPPDVNVTSPTPDVNVKVEPPASSNTTG